MHMQGRVYIETSIVSYLTGRVSNDTVIAAHQKLTALWWNERAPLFDLVVSELVLQESSGGDPGASRLRLGALSNMNILLITEEAITLAALLSTQGPIHREHVVDALHIAIAAVNEVDYLLTWNCKHLANASHRGRIEALITGAGYKCPIICTPEELMEE